MSYTVSFTEDDMCGKAYLPLDSTFNITVCESVLGIDPKSFDLNYTYPKILFYPYKHRYFLPFFLFSPRKHASENLLESFNCQTFYIYRC